MYSAAFWGDTRSFGVSSSASTAASSASCPRSEVRCVWNPLSTIEV